MPNIILTGFMGTGKSTVGRILSRTLGMKFIDMDDLIEKEAGMPVKEIFARFGEPHFRELEAGVVKKLVSGALGRGLIISTGGGAVLNSSNRALLRGWGVVICLKATVDEILERVGDRTDRPLLARPDRKQAIIDLLKQREASYRDCDYEVDTTAMDVDEVSSVIMKLLEDRKRNA